MDLPAHALSMSPSPEISRAIKDYVLHGSESLDGILDDLAGFTDFIDIAEDIIRCGLKVVLRSKEYNSQDAQQRFEYVASRLSGSVGVNQAVSKIEIHASGEQEPDASEDEDEDITIDAKGLALLSIVRRDANCKGVYDGRFFPGRGESIKPAQEVCAGCYVRDECTRYAIENREKFGVWGGLSERERRRLRKRERSIQADKNNTLLATKK